MFVIAGLGNPTKEYENTRHNIGFMTIDALADKYDIHVGSVQHKALVGKGMIGAKKVILAKPQTYMNLSGESIRELVDYYKLDPSSELIVISDDIDLPPGYIRVRPRGSAGGHNGLKNIILNLDTENFLRIRLGVGAKPEKMNLADHVLGHFKPDEMDDVGAAIDDAVGAIELLTKDKLSGAMNTYNRKVQPQKTE